VNRSESRYVRVEALSKSFGPTTVIERLDMEVEEGEFVVLLGPSGCGKTTTLRCLAGLEAPTAGTISLGGGTVFDRCAKIDRSPDKRSIGMVFQSYALWPHMTVFENVAYPLKLRWEKKNDIRQKVNAALDLVGLRGLEDRPAPALSGGQQQRVALARALVFSPRVLLLDEPLSNLDARLRDEMRQELKALQRRVGVTMVFVTHDQIEGLSLSDRIAIMHRGQLLQVGTPEDVYHRPAAAIVRDFLGKIFSLAGKIVETGDNRLRVAVHATTDKPLTVPERCLPETAGAFAVGQSVLLAIRPEKVTVWNSAPDGKPNLVQATLESAHFLGDRYEYTVVIGGEKHLMILPATETHRVGAQIFLELKPEEITLWPAAESV